MVDIKFQPDELPDIYNASDCQMKMPSRASVAGEGRKDMVLEVMQHLGDDVVRCVAMSSTEGLTRHEGCGYGRSYYGSRGPKP